VPSAGGGRRARARIRAALPVPAGARRPFFDAAALVAAIESYEVVFHLVHASTPHSANLDMAADLQQNIVSSIALLDISRNLGVKRIVFVSSGGVVYGQAKQIPTPFLRLEHDILSKNSSHPAIRRSVGSELSWPIRHRATGRS
jgi:nucleoside-diphosphate-sugar epimerase